MSRVSFTSLAVALSCAALAFGGCSGGTKGGNPPGSDGGPGLDGGGGQDCTVSGCPSSYQCNPTTKSCDPMPGTPCASNNPPADCGKDCSLLSAVCQAPTYCSNGVCTSDCDPSGSNTCGAGMVCDPSGKCVVDTTPDGGVYSDACAPTQVNANPVVPTVVLIIDQSGSMDNPYPAGSTTSRWQAIGAALTGTSGIVTQLQSVVRFGALLFSATNSQCPDETKITPALNNFTPIDNALMQGTINYTPTGMAITDTTAWLRSQPQVPSSGTITWNGDPVIYVLATDGEPNGCDRYTSQADYDAVTTAVTDAYNAGVDTYVISVAVNSTTQSFLDTVATDGGTNCEPTAMPPHAACPADNPADLASAISNIVKNQISCNIKLNGTITTNNVCADGQVQLSVSGGAEMNVPCLGDCAAPTGSDGWCDMDASHISLIGSYCQTLQGGQSVSLTATFACGAFHGT